MTQNLEAFTSGCQCGQVSHPVCGPANAFAPSFAGSRRQIAPNLPRLCWPRERRGASCQVGRLSFLALELGKSVARVLEQGDCESAEGALPSSGMSLAVEFDRVKKAF